MVGEMLDGKSVSAASKDGNIQGCYIHGIFSNDSFRSKYIKGLGATPSELNFNSKVDDTLNQLSNHIEHFIDLDKLISLAE